MRAYLTSYATPSFEKVQRELNVSGLKWGIPNVLSYHERELRKSDYYRENRSILDEVCGAGFWAWKPFVILQALSQLSEGDVLFYCDSGTLIVESVQPLIELCLENPQGLILFDARPLTNRQFTKRDCFVRMGCDTPEHWNGRKVIATILVIRKCDFATKLVSEWLEYCQDRAIITDDANTEGLDNLDNFLEHRHDQSILSLLASKYSLETYRNPTVWGNFLKLPEFRVPSEAVIGPYFLFPEINTYSKAPQENSPYGTIFVINRQPNYLGKVTGPPKPAPRRSLIHRGLSKIKRTLMPEGGQGSLR